MLEDGTRFAFLRQQSDYGDSRPNRSLADYVAPDGDHLGAFAVSIHGADELAARYEAEHDDYRAIMAKALADRLAEAFAEYLHERARFDWGYEQERLSSEELDRRALSRHPARLRLSRVPRPLREDAALRAARAQDGGHGADRDLRHAAGGERQRPLLPPPGGALLLDRPGRPRPGRGLRGAKKGSSPPRPSAGSRRIWPTPAGRAGAGYPVGLERAPTGRSLLFRMRTTLKRGIGRSTAGTGTATATRSAACGRSRPSRGTSSSCRGAAAGCGSAASSSGCSRSSLLVVGGDCRRRVPLLPRERRRRSAAHSKDVKLAPRTLDIPLPNQPAIALVVGYDKRTAPTRHQRLALRHDDAAARRSDVRTRSRCSRSRATSSATLWCGDSIVGTDRINGAYALCGSKGDARHGEAPHGPPDQLPDHRQLPRLHPDRRPVGGVWVDVDRRYYNKNVGTAATNFANIDLRPGYQQLKGRRRSPTCASGTPTPTSSASRASSSS